MKNYKIKIYFHSGQSDLFGYSGDCVECIVTEENKDKILVMLAEDEKEVKLLGINMQEGGMGIRYINMRNVLYIDVKEVEDEKESK